MFFINKGELTLVGEAPYVYFALWIENTYVKNIHGRLKLPFKAWSTISLTRKNIEAHEGVVLSNLIGVG